MTLNLEWYHVQHLRVSRGAASKLTFFLSSPMPCFLIVLFCFDNLVILMTFLWNDVSLTTVLIVYLTSWLPLSSRWHVSLSEKCTKNEVFHKENFTFWIFTFWIGKQKKISSCHVTIKVLNISPVSGGSTWFDYEMISEWYLYEIVFLAKQKGLAHQSMCAWKRFFKSILLSYCKLPWNYNKHS